MFSSFPYKPYHIQLEFMKKLYKVLDEKQIGLFESPTGTGKTLCLITASLEWLEKNRYKKIEKEEEDDDKPAWILQQKKKLKKIKRENRRKRQSQRLERIREKRKKESPEADVFSLEESEEAEFLIRSPITQHKSEQSESATDDEDDEICDDDDDDDENDEQNKGPKRKIIITSRTHSQLKQILGEISKTRFPEIFSIVTLASRKSYCVNEKVRKLNNLHQINDTCIELQNQKNTKRQKNSDNSLFKCGGCPYNKRNNGKHQKKFKQEILSNPMDIEELANMGRERGLCPYYASRNALKEADVILMPYPMLINEDTRNALGIELEDNVVIVDEAHNLVDALTNTFRTTITNFDVDKVKVMFQNYLSRFSSRMNDNNLENAKLCEKVLSSLSKLLHREFEFQKSLVININTFLCETDLDNINLSKLAHWARLTKLGYKISSYCSSVSDGTETLENSINAIENDKRKSIDSIHAYLNFVSALGKENNVCSILLEKINKQGLRRLTYMLLDPAIYFKTIVDKSHALVLASGTLSPMTLVKNQLFPHIIQNSNLNKKTKDQDIVNKDIVEFKCDHIISKDKLLVLSLMNGPHSEPLDLRYENRGLHEIMDEVGEAIYNLCDVIPEGFVIFVPSFEYAFRLYERLRAIGTIDKISKKKKFFMEPAATGASSGPGDCEKLFREYKNHILKQGKGAILCCIIGGKLSEGINFDDQLGRCVLLLGLPYPPFNNIELQERIRHLISNKDMHKTSKEIHEELCSRAINQSIGRVIRHVNDHACIILGDKRYDASCEQIRQLPHWLKGSYVGSCNFKQATLCMHDFFKKFKSHNED